MWGSSDAPYCPSNEGCIPESMRGTMSPLGGNPRPSRTGRRQNRNFRSQLIIRKKRCTRILRFLNSILSSFLVRCLRFSEKRKYILLKFKIWGGESSWPRRRRLKRRKKRRKKRRNSDLRIKPSLNSTSQFFLLKVEQPPSFSEKSMSVLSFGVKKLVM